MLHDIYLPSQNLERSWGNLMLHLVEVSASFNKQIFRRNDRAEAHDALARMFAWYCALCDAAELVDLQSAVFSKFPRACLYCGEDTCECTEGRPDVDAQRRADLVESRDDDQPVSLDEWQTVIGTIYDQAKSGEYEAETGTLRRELARKHMRLVLSRLLEELGEVTEALRFRRIRDERELHDEFADVFGWLMAAANVVGEVFEPRQDVRLAELVWNRYPGLCPSCQRRHCRCWQPANRFGS